MESFKILDESVLDGLRKFGQPAFIVKMVDLFLRTTGPSVDAIEKGASESDWQSAGFAAHSLKSSSGNLGLPRLTEIVQRIEDACRHGREEDARRLSAELRPIWTASCKALGDYRAKVA
jgi:HPt (histidine-containing phosphotransfer) domain-containing protein